jgi:arsenate reductase (thioredoxin)
MSRKPRVLVICTGNSMRSQVAEAVLRLDLGDRIEVFSAGTHPGKVHPLTIATLADIGYNALQHRSKSVNEFLDTPMDLVITVCDRAREACPVFPGAHKTVHQSYPDPIHSGSPGDWELTMADIRDRMRRELCALVIRELNLDAAP